MIWALTEHWFVVSMKLKNVDTLFPHVDVIDMYARMVDDCQQSKHVSWLTWFLSSPIKKEEGSTTQVQGC